MSEHDVVLVYGEDWDGIYINGELVSEGHSLNLSVVLTLLGIKNKETYAAWKTFEDNGYRLPANLSDVTPEE